jgi:hypothetical protein
MMHHDPDLHLSDDELLRAMIDPADLDPVRRAHFDACPHCRRQSEELTRPLSRLGQLARQMAPEPRKSFRLPAHSAPVRRWYVKPALALGALGVLVFAVTLWRPLTRTSRTPTPMVAHQVENDEQLMEEIDTLVENALPEKYQQLAALSGDRSVEDLDEFMDWMVPSPGEADDMELPADPDRESRQDPLAWSQATVDAERGTV